MQPHRQPHRPARRPPAAQLNALLPSDPHSPLAPLTLRPARAATEGLVIPPPRAKRKPSRPYPRSNTSADPTSQSAGAGATATGGTPADTPGAEFTASAAAGVSGVVSGGGAAGTALGSQATGLAAGGQQSKLSLPVPPRSADAPPLPPLSAELLGPLAGGPLAGGPLAELPQGVMEALTHSALAGGCLPPGLAGPLGGDALTATSQYAEITEASVAAVAAAASAAAAAAAAAVVAAAGQQVQAYLQAHPPQGFPFFGMPPSLLAQLTMQAPAVEVSGACGALGSGVAMAGCEVWHSLGHTLRG